MNWLKLMGLLFIFSSCGGSQLFVEATATAAASLKVRYKKIKYVIL